MRTKIICSIGPSSDREAVLRALIENGMDVARLNFSHDAQKKHGQRIEKIRKLSRQLNREVEILCDLQGPKIRLAEQPILPLKVSDDQIITFYTGKIKNKKNAVKIEDPYLHSDLQQGDIILIDDGQIELIVEDLEQNRIMARVVRGGELFSKKGVNVPGTITTTSSLTEKDLADLKFILPYQPEWISQSFVQSAEDVIKLKKLIGRRPIRIMSKIERAGAIENLTKIIDEANGIMVARGDLGVEIPIEKLPVIQKQIIRECNDTGTPVVTATHMLASMTKTPFPTRAEVSDIANAVLDGTDFVMLSNETTVGDYPIESLKIMVKIVDATEKFLVNNRNRIKAH